MRTLLIALTVLFSVQSFAFDNVPVQLKCLWSGYKSFKISGDRRLLVFDDGSTLPFDGNPVPADPEYPTNILQMFWTPYPFGFTTGADGKKTFRRPYKNEDPGRTRYQNLFFKLYGDAPAKVERDLVAVKWIDGSRIQFNKRYGAAAYLQRVSDQLAALVQKDPSMKKYLQQPIGGTYEWREIAGSKNLSVHSWGAAIDINTKYTDYWRWDMKPDGSFGYKNRIPAEIAEIFENNGFVWGAKWYHYDTMHFEFRPELIMKNDVCEREFLKYRD